MRIYTRAGDLAFKTFTFSDSQPHFQLSTYERDFSTATIELSIKSPVDLFMVLLVADTLRQHGYEQLNLDVRYLMGARMDRAISPLEPYTLQVVARVINSVGFTKVRILDAHSEVATRLIRNSSNVLPFAIVDQVKTTLGNPVIVCPDKGAQERTRALAGASPVVYCSKKRDTSTGTLSGFSVDVVGPGGSYAPFEGLIIDDLCDGGGTFVGLTKELRKWGATKVFLFVTHGLFSKGLPLEGIDKIYTTDSICTRDRQGTNPTWDNRPGSAIVIPISMEKL